MNSTESVQPSKKDSNTEGTSKSQEKQLLLSDIHTHQEQDPDVALLFSWVLCSRRPDWNEISKSSPEVKYYWNRFESLLIEDGVLYMKYDDRGQMKKLMIVPRSLVNVVLRQLHDSPCAGHLGVQKTYDKDFTGMV